MNHSEDQRTQPADTRQVQEAERNIGRRANTLQRMGYVREADRISMSRPFGLSRNSRSSNIPRPRLASQRLQGPCRHKIRLAYRPTRHQIAVHAHVVVFFHDHGDFRLLLERGSELLHGLILTNRRVSPVVIECPSFTREKQVTTREKTRFCLRMRRSQGDRSKRHTPGRDEVLRAHFLAR